MKKPNLSKTAMKRFFLLHSEKLILGIALILFGVFFWIGYKTPLFSSKTPEQLSAMADEADRHILRPTSWDSIKELRKGKSQALEIIDAAANNIKFEDFASNPISGVAAATLAKREDPMIYPIIEPFAVSIRAPVIANFDDGISDPFSDWPLVSAAVKKPTGGNDTQNKFGSDDPGGDDRSTKKTKKDEYPVVDAGTEAFQVNEDTTNGILPGIHRISNASNKSRVLNMVIVTGLVDVKQQWNSYDKCFKSGIGYFPARDKPSYQYLQVQRRVIGDDGKPVEGDDGEWVDRSEDVSYTVPKLYPTMYQMPNARFQSAPEVVHPHHWDPILTGPIPSITMFDYQPWVNHPKLASTPRAFPEIKPADDGAKKGPTGFFDRDPKDADASNKRSGKFGKGGQGGMGGGDGAGGPGTPSAGGSGGGKGGGGFKGDALAEQTRQGSDFADYAKSLNAKEPLADFKLVRFFDLRTKVGVTYEYRMRLWIADPNQEDPSSSFNNLFGSNSGGGDGASDGGEGNDGGEDGGTRKNYPKTTITNQMLVKNVRVRLRSQTSKAAPDDKDGKVFFVTELRDPEGNGKLEYVKIAVPNRPEAGDHNYLRFARPSTWSDTVKVTVEGQNPRVAAGATLNPKLARIDGKEFPVGEPVTELVASVWSTEFGTAIPAKRQVYRGDALDFWANSYVLHPITRRVHLAVNLDSEAEGLGKYLVPIKTGNVVVDTLGGNELALPRGEKKRHYLATEVLVMDAFGNFHVQNDMQDSSSYRNHLLLADSTRYNAPERRTKEKKSDDPGRGGSGSGKFGGAGGGGAGGAGGPGGEGGAGGEGPDF